MALKDEAKELAEYIESNKPYMARNAQLFDIYQGNLLPYVRKILEETLSEQYFSKIKSRIFPINILRRVIDKLSQTYRNEPIRTASSNQDTLELYEDWLEIDVKLNAADEFANLFKGYALEPFILEGVPKLRVLPFDRFLVKSNDRIDPTRVTHFMKHIGKANRVTDKGTQDLDIWFIYTDTEFIAIDEEGNIALEFMKDPDTGETLDGSNPLGFIPFYYANRSDYSVLPKQDTDTLELSKLLPVLISDIAGAAMFQCFSIIFGIDLNFENAIMSPNALWDIKSDPESDKTPTLGTLKPEVDIEKIMGFIKDTFSTWMETKGIRVGAIGNTDGNSSASGISKIIDEMDTFEARNKSIKSFVKDERNFWDLLRRIHNSWVASGELPKQSLLPENWAVITEFDAPSPIVDRDSEVATAIMERDGGVISQRTLIKKLYPNWGDKEIEKEIKDMGSEVI